MTGPTKPPSGGAPRQPWTPDQASNGVTCPACGLANEAGARVCRNCGLPIASANDPLRGVAPGSVNLPSTQRSGLSATIGLLLVVGLLLVGGTLAFSGGGILGSGGRLVPGPEAGSTTAPLGSGEPVDGGILTGSNDGNGIVPDATLTATSTAFDYTCDDAAITDKSKIRWLLSEVQAGPRSDEDGTYDQIYWKLTQDSAKKNKKGTTVTMEWTTPKEAQQAYGIARVQGDRAIVVTFDGPVKITANQTIETAQLEAAGIDQVKKIQLFQGDDGKVRTAIGLSTDSCARMRASNWGGKAKQNSKVMLDVENFDGP